MPESVQDRPTRSHEYVFLFSKQARYFYDAEAVREPGSPNTRPHFAIGTTSGTMDGKWTERHGGSKPDYWITQDVQGRNARTVWRIASEPFSGSHFATFPPALVRRCLLAGAPTQVCVACGAPWKREVEAGPVAEGYTPGFSPAFQVRRFASATPGFTRQRTTLGFSPTCACQHASMPATVLDPFCGSGTTLVVARELGHHAIGIDLSYPYLHDIARERLGLSALARWEGQSVRTAPGVSYEDLPLFGRR